MDPTFALILGALIGWGAEFAFDFFVMRKKRSPLPDSSLVASLEQAQAEVARLKTHVANLEPLRDQLSMKQAEIDDLKEEMFSGHEGDAALTTLRADNSKLESKVKFIEDTVRARDEQITALKIQLEKVQSNSGSGDTTELEAANQAIASLKADLAVKENYLSEANKKLRDISSQGGSTPASTVELDSLRNQLMEQANELARRQTEYEERGQHILQLQADARDLEAHIAKLQEASASQSDLASQVISMQNEGAAKDDRIQDLENSLRDLESQLSHAHELGADLQDWRTRAEVAENAEAELQEVTARLNRQIQELNAQLGQGLEQKNKELQDEVENWRSRFASLERDVDSLREVSSSKDQAIAESRAAVGSLEAQLAFRPTHDDLSKLKAEIVAKDEHIRELSSQLMRSTMTPSTAEAVAAPAPQRVFSATPPRAPFIQISGIGHLYERKLWEAGILTFDALSACSVDQLYEIIQPAEWQRIEPEKWIEEAAQLAEEAAS